MMRFEELATPHRDALSIFARELIASDPESAASFFPLPWSDLVARDFLTRAAAERRDWRPKARETSRTRYVGFDDAGELVALAVMQFPLGPDAPDNFLFVVSPRHRGRGFGTLILNRLLFEGARAGLARARVSCRSGDEAARRCITRNRGELETEGGRASFWIKLR